MESYAWTITAEFIEDDKAVGRVGPSGTQLTAEQISNSSEARPFRMLDSDGELYYRGFLIGGDGFEPLDEFGRPNAGATEIQFKNARGKWEPL